MKPKRIQRNEILTSELKSLELKNGSLTPKVVVDAAREKDHPLHNYFEWNNTTAGEAYRLWQARQLIASVTVVIQGKKTPAYYNYQSNVTSVEQTGYYSVDKVLSKDEIYKQVLESALSEIEYWQKKYGALKELRGLVNKNKLSFLRRGQAS
jgi:hypothetical protein